MPNSRPDSPHRAACAAAEGSRAPPPQTIRVPWRSISPSSPSSFKTRPRNPPSATSRFDPEPTTATWIPCEAAQSNTLANSSSSVGRAKRSAGPPVRTVVNRARG